MHSQIKIGVKSNVIHFFQKVFLVVLRRKMSEITHTLVV